MPELRKDPILERWVVISSERINRPTDFRNRRETRANGGFCPFCEGNEYTTPPEILAFRDRTTPADSPGWSLRVVPNKFPALTIEGALESRGDELFRSMSGIGAHEVVIETPDHDRMLEALTPGEIEDVFRAYRLRLLDLGRDRRLHYVMIFKNHGPDAGATLEHSHSQLIALPIVPKQIREELEGSSSYYRRHGSCVFCDTIEREISSGERIVAESGQFVVLAPYASPFSFETWILPKQHTPFFDRSAEHYEDLATVLRDLLRRMIGVLDDPDYNFVVHTAPLRAEDEPHFHWHLELRPRTTRIAGFEWGSGFYINPIPPEKAAAFLREAGES